MLLPSLLLLLLLLLSVWLLLLLFSVVIIIIIVIINSADGTALFIISRWNRPWEKRICYLSGREAREI